MKSIYLILILFLLLPWYTMADNAPEYVPGYIIMKTENTISEHRQRDGRGDQLAQWIQNNVSDYRSILPESRMRDGNSDDTGKIQKSEDRLSRTYKISLGTSEDPAELSGKVAQMDGVVYAEPWYNYKLQEGYIPNDSRIGLEGHDYFEYHRIFEAWDINRSSSSIVIAIIDSGVYYDHPELENKLWRNPNPERPEVREVFPEVENDTIGWNFWQDGDIFNGEERIYNADPIADYSDHGTHVAGLAAAEPDNGLEVAGTGFHAQFMPVKTGGNKLYPRSVPFGVQGILYAALNGADIINASFGTTSYSDFARDVVRYANQLGSLVVGAAGNNADSRAFYPAAYPEALSVGAVDNDYNDKLSAFSSFGFHTDVFAIGSAVYSTSFRFSEDNGNRSWEPEYRITSGTSMATPIVSGIAALIRDHNPHWSPERVRMQLRNSSQSIVDANTDKNQYHLGQGRLNALKALQEPQPGVEVVDHEFVNDNGQKLDAGESGKVRLDMINHGSNLSELDVFSDIYTEGFEITAERTYREYDSQYRASLPVDFSGEFDLSKYPKVILKYKSRDGEYEDFFPVRFQEVFHDLAESRNLKASFSSEGRIGYRKPDNAQEGRGIIPEIADTSIIAESGLMLHLRADGRNRLIDAVRYMDTQSDDFMPQKLFRKRNENYSTRFTSENHDDFPYADVSMQVFPVDEDEAGQTMLIKYRITNTSEYRWDNLYAGIFTDWTLDDAAHQANYIEPDSIHYVHTDDLYASFSHISPVSSAFAIDNLSSMTLERAQDRQDSLSFGTVYGNQADGHDGFRIEEKRLALTAGIEQVSLNADDMGSVSASGPYSVEPGDEVTLGFVLGWAESLSALRNQVDVARSIAPFEISEKDVFVSSPQEQTSDIPEKTELQPNYPNPFNNQTSIELSLSQQDDVRMDIYDITGRRLATLHNDPLDAGTHTFEFEPTGLSSGVYVIVARTHTGTLTRNITYLK